MAFTLRQLVVLRYVVMVLQLINTITLILVMNFIEYDSGVYIIPLVVFFVFTVIFVIVSVWIRREVVLQLRSQQVLTPVPQMMPPSMPQNMPQNMPQQYVTHMPPRSDAPPLYSAGPDQAPPAYDQVASGFAPTASGFAPSAPGFAPSSAEMGTSQDVRSPPARGVKLSRW